MSILQAARRLVIGKSRDPLDPRVFHHLSLAAFLAWVGLGADGLSSSCYGPEEAFITLGEHTHLAVFLAIAMMVTIAVISASYAQIISLFPSGGGGYLVATSLLGTGSGGRLGLGARRRLRDDDRDAGGGLGRGALLPRAEGRCPSGSSSSSR